MTAAVDTAQLRPLLESYLQEAQHGPAGSGKATSVTLRGVALEVAASRGWGVRFTRRLPDGQTLHRHLATGELTLAQAEDAVRELATAR